jgi:PAS domain S-box-containing protein
MPHNETQFIGEDKNWVNLWREPSGLRAVILGFIILSLIAVVGIVVYATGGTVFVWAHLMYLPIILAAASFGIYGGIAAALIGALVLGPYMPMDVAHGLSQPLHNWIFRMVFFLLVGTLSGLISKVLNTQIGKIKRREEHIRYILNNTKDVIFQIDLNGNYIYGNAATEQLTGYPLSELLQMNMMQLVASEYHALVSERLQRRLANEANEKPYEIEIQHKDGHGIWTELTTREIYNRERQLIGIQGVARDITERKRAAESLTLFRTLLDHANDAIEVVDPKTWRYLDVNEKASQIHGYTREEYLALTISDIDPQFAAGGVKTWNAHLEAFQRFGSLIFESEHRRKDGSIFPVEVNASYIRLQRDYVLAVVRDITERKRVEQAVRHERDFSEALLNSLPGVFYLYDQNGKFLRWNKNFEQVTGYTVDEMKTLHPLDFFAEAEKELVAARINEVLQKGASYVEADFLSKDGRKTPYYFTGVLAQIDGQDCVVGVGIDVTARKRAEIWRCNSGSRKRWRPSASLPAAWRMTSTTFLASSKCNLIC